MTEHLNSEIAAIGIRLVDDAYMAWLSSETDSENALQAWIKAAGANRDTAYQAYRAALDREEAAALDLQRLSELAQPLCRPAVQRGADVELIDVRLRRTR